MKLRWRIFSGSSIVTGLLAIAWIGPEDSPVFSSASAQTTGICFVKSAEHDCKGNCTTDACRQREAAEQAESERRAQLTPAEREAEDALQRRQSEERAARERAEREARLAREATERRIAEAARKARIDGLMRQLNIPENRRAEAERLAAMREAAERARGPVKKPTANKVCQAAAWRHVESWTYLPMEDISASYAKMSTYKRCRSGKFATVAPLQCKKKWSYLGTPMGTCGTVLNCPATSYACSSTKVTNQ